MRQYIYKIYIHICVYTNTYIYIIHDYISIGGP